MIGKKLVLVRPNDGKMHVYTRKECQLVADIFLKLGAPVITITEAALEEIGDFAKENADRLVYIVGFGHTPPRMFEDTPDNVSFIHRLPRDTYHPRPTDWLKRSMTGRVLSCLATDLMSDEFIECLPPETIIETTDRVTMSGDYIYDVSDGSVYIKSARRLYELDQTLLFEIAETNCLPNALIGKCPGIDKDRFMNHLKGVYA
jgi:hypothetical protein